MFASHVKRGRHLQVQFMKKAVEEVEKCRTTLKWTYVMAYYLAKGDEKDLFEDNQRDLEKAVEDLSELLESPIEPEEIMTLRQKVIDKTVCSARIIKENEIYGPFRCTSRSETTEYSKTLLMDSSRADGTGTYMSTALTPLRPLQFNMAYRFLCWRTLPIWVTRMWLSYRFISH